MSVEASYSTQTTPLYIAGMGYVDNFISGPTEGQFQVSRYMLGPDFIKDIGDEATVTGGVILNNGQGVGFTRGRLLNYTVSCNVGSVPEISNTFKAYGNLGGGISPIARWDARTQYQGDYLDGPTLASVSKTSSDTANLGLAEDEIYQCHTTLDDFAWYYEHKVTLTRINRDTWFNLPEGPDETLDTKDDYTDIGYIKPIDDIGGSTTGSYWSKVNHLKAKESLEDQFAIEKREYTVPTQGSITVEFAGSVENAVLGFNYTRGLDLESLYALREEKFKGTPLTDYEALDIQIIYPIKTTLDFTVSFDNYKLSDMRAFLDYANWNNSKIEQDIAVRVYDPQNMDTNATGDEPGAPIMEYKINKAKLLSESISAQTADDTTLTISFEGYETDAVTPDPHDATTHGVDHSTEFPVADSVNLENKISQVKT